LAGILFPWEWSHQRATLAPIIQCITLLTVPFFMAPIFPPIGTHQL